MRTNVTSHASNQITFSAETMKLSDGRTVIEIAEAMGPHPHPQHNGKLVPISTVQMLLVENANGDPVEMYACDWPGGDICGRTYDNIKSVTSHQTYHSPTKNSSHYPVETLKLVIRTVKLAKRDIGTRGCMMEAAKTLNEQNIPTAQGNPWTAQSVGSLYNHWEPKIPVRVYRKRVTESVSAPPADSSITMRNDNGRLTIVNASEIGVSTNSPKITDTAHSPVVRIGRLFDDVTSGMNDAQKLMDALKTEVLDLATQVEKYSTVNDEIREKADKYDVLRSMLGQTE